MKLTLTHGDRDIVILEVTISKACWLTVSLRFGRKRTAPQPSKDPGPNLRASGGLSSSERAYPPRPTTTVGFTRR